MTLGPGFNRLRRNGSSISPGRCFTAWRLSGPLASLPRHGIRLGRETPIRSIPLEVPTQQPWVFVRAHCQASHARHFNTRPPGPRCPSAGESAGVRLISGDEPLPVVRAPLPVNGVRMRVTPVATGWNWRTDDDRPRVRERR